MFMSLVVKNRDDAKDNQNKQSNRQFIMKTNGSVASM